MSTVYIIVLWVRQAIRPITFSLSDQITCIQTQHGILANFDYLVV